MNCYACGTQLPPEAKICPNCGTITPAYYSNSGVSPYDPTKPSGASPFPRAGSTPPPTHYGSNPYGAPLQNPYVPSNPYQQPLRPPPPPPFRHRRKLGLLVGFMVLVLVLVSGSVLAFLTQRQILMPTATSSPTSITATRTSTPQEIYNQATSGSPVFNDPLTGQSSNHWIKVSTASQGYDCVFTEGGYHVSMLQGGVTGCLAEGTSFSNFAFQVQMTIIKGDGGGLLFRRNDPTSFGYRFFVGPEYYDLTYNDEHLTANYTGFKAIWGHTYLLTVIARGSSIYLYVNKQCLATVEDTSSGFGTIGFMAYDKTLQTEVVFSNAQVWTL